MLRRSLVAFGLLLASYGRAHNLAHDTTNGVTHDHFALHHPLPAHATSDWTIMVYMSGDNDMEAQMISDIENEFAYLGSTAEVQIMVLADRIPGHDKTSGECRRGKRRHERLNALRVPPLRPPQPERKPTLNPLCFLASAGDWTGTKLFKVYQNMKATASQALEDWGERNLADVASLVEFVSRCRERAPAEKYMLVLWGKGGAWHRGLTLADATSGGAAMDLDALRGATKALGQVDAVAYDGGGHSAGIEVASMWRAMGAGAVAFSEASAVGTGGVAWDHVLLHLNSQGYTGWGPDMGAVDLAALVVASSTQGTSALAPSRTFSAVALDDRFTGLVNATNEWVASLERLLSTRPGTTAGVDGAANRLKLRGAFAAAKGFGGAGSPFSGDRDLYDMASQVQTLGLKEAYGVEESNLVRFTSAALMAAVEGAVVAEAHDAGHTGAHGLTAFHATCAPSTKTPAFAFYQSLDWAAESTWDEFLDSFATKLGCAY